jgi:hypothetical protein
MAGLVPRNPDARDKSAITRVCDALLPAHDDRNERDRLQLHSDEVGSVLSESVIGECSK